MQQNGLVEEKPQEQLNEEDHEKTKFDEGKQLAAKETQELGEQLWFEFITDHYNSDTEQDEEENQVEMVGLLVWKKNTRKNLPHQEH